MIRPISRLYLAGPMTGIPEYNYPAFHAAEEAVLRVAPHLEVVNPARFHYHEDGTPDFTKERHEYLRAAVEAVLTVDAVMTLPGASNSAGALLEIRVAEALELPVLEYNEATLAGMAVGTAIADLAVGTLDKLLTDLGIRP